MKNLIFAISLCLLVGCVSNHEPLSDFGDAWGDKLGLNVEPPEQYETDATSPATEEAPQN